MITVDISAIRKAHKRLLAETNTAIARAAVSAGEFAVNHVKAHPTFRPRTHNLQNSTDWRVVRIRGGRVIRIRNSAKYAHAIDLGARPHKIRARRRKALRFVVGGRVLFRRSVNHPGNRPYRFLYRATFAAGRILQQDLAHAMIRIARSF